MELVSKPLSQMLVNDKLERIWKEAAVTCSRHFQKDGPRKTMKKSVTATDVPVGIRSSHISNMTY